MSNSHDESSPSRWQRLRQVATQVASDVLENESVDNVMKKTKDLATAGSDAAASVFTGARKAVTQEEAWEQMEQAIAALTDVATVQHAMILDLLTRVTNLEQRVTDDSEKGV